MRLEKLGLLCRSAVDKGLLDEYWEEKKALSPASVVRVFFSEDVLRRIRRELNKKAPARLEIEDVFKSVRDVISKEALLEVGEISMTKKRKKRKKTAKTDDTVAGVSSDGAE